VARSESVRRIKSYSAATGCVYQYYFTEVRKARRGFTAGREYIYMVSANRKALFPVAIFVAGDALRKWAQAAGRELTGTEEYAVAKLRLFEAFDELQNLGVAPPDLRVDQSNLEALLARLDI